MNERRAIDILFKEDCIKIDREFKSLCAGDFEYDPDTEEWRDFANRPIFEYINWEMDCNLNGQILEEYFIRKLNEECFDFVINGVSTKMPKKDISKVIIDERRNMVRVEYKEGFNNGAVECKF